MFLEFKEWGAGEVVQLQKSKQTWTLNEPVQFCIFISGGVIRISGWEWAIKLDVELLGMQRILEEWAIDSLGFHVI